MILMKSNNLLNYRLNRHTDINIVKEGGWLDLSELIYTQLTL